MSPFTHLVRVANPRGTAPPIEIKLLVETGAMFAPQLEAIGVRPEWQVPIGLAAGRQEEWSAAEIFMTIGARTLHTTCLFGPPDSLPLLGAVSLEQFGLCPDPLARRLVPTRVPMACSA